MSCDAIVIKFILITAIFLGYAGFIMPMIICSWWFVVFGLIYNLGEIVNKYYVGIPDAEHIHKV